MTKSDTTPIERARTIDRLSKSWAATVAERLNAEGVDAKVLSRQMASLVGSNNGTILLFLATAIRGLTQELLVDPDRPAEFPDDLVLPVIAATVVQLATHMQVIPIPDDPQDFH